MSRRERLPSVGECVRLVEEFKAKNGVYPRNQFYSDATRKTVASEESRMLWKIMLYAARKQGEDAEVDAFAHRYRSEIAARGRVSKGRKPRDVQELQVESVKIERAGGLIYQEPTPTPVEVEPASPSRAKVSKGYHLSLNGAANLLGEGGRGIVQVSTGDGRTSVRLFVQGARDLYDQVGVILGGMLPRIYDVKPLGDTHED